MQIRRWQVPEVRIDEPGIGIEQPRRKLVGLDAQIRASELNALDSHGLRVDAKR